MFNQVSFDTLQSFQRLCLQGSKKVPSGRSVQIDFCVGQVTFPTHLPDGQGYEQAARELS